MPSQAGNGFFRLVVLGVTGLVLVAAAGPVTNFVIGSGAAWSGETRHGIIAEQGISIGIASVSGAQPALPVASFGEHGEADLFVFDQVGSQSARVPSGQSPIDLCWLDGSLTVLRADRDFALSEADQAIGSPAGSLFLLVTPAGLVPDVRPGDRLVLI